VTAGSWFLRPLSSASEGCRREVIVDAFVLSELALDGAQDTIRPDIDHSGILDPLGDGDTSDPVLSMIFHPGDIRGEFSPEAGGVCATPP
jgi:hypothetical protein